ncbi:MFS transporter [Lacibacterium aquatile]|uniref:Uncharacterized MFS-type transporter ACFSM5_01865 n=1 Tax=Lacibacterium aquatile TaxID=1168082 RepID=A0ABW5DNU6_9PROT
MTTQTSPSSTDISVLTGLGPLVFVVFFGFLAIGIPLPTLGLEVHGTLGFGASVVGWVIGSQSAATVLTRHAGGVYSDRHGPKRAVMLGLPLAVLAGLLYLLASSLTEPKFALGVLLAGRLILGLGESLFLTGTMSWGIARLGPARTGKVMAWQGIAMYGALAIGAPVGLAIQGRFGFTGVALASTLAPLLACLVAAGLARVPGSGGTRVPFYRVIGLIWRPGLVLALATVPFAVMSTFLALHFAAKGWEGAGLAITGFGIGYITVRLFIAHWPDKFGGVRVAGFSLLVEIAGQAVLWSADSALLALVGALLTGVGFSLIFPSMGVEATRRVAPELRGQAVGNFIAFFDIAIGLGGPAAGLLASGFGYGASFGIGTASAVLALVMLPLVARMGR